VAIGSSGLINVPDNVFSNGDAVLVFNNTNATSNMTMSIATAYIAGTDADKENIAISARGLASILFINSTACVVTGNVS
jgi:hypothetical protein